MGTLDRPPGLGPSPPGDSRGRSSSPASCSARVAQITRSALRIAGQAALTVTVPVQIQPPEPPPSHNDEARPAGPCGVPRATRLQNGDGPARLRARSPRHPPCISRRGRAEPSSLQSGRTDRFDTGACDVAVWPVAYALPLRSTGDCEGRPSNALTLEQAEAGAGAAEHSRLRPYIMLSLLVRASPGELRGLTRDDLDVHGRVTAGAVIPPSIVVIRSVTCEATSRRARLGVDWRCP